jgi:glycerol-3-phosphate dehydrogenase
MNIVIVGAGNVGRALGSGWLKTGHKVTMAVREPTSSKAIELKKRLLVPVHHRRSSPSRCGPPTEQLTARRGISQVPTRSICA